MKPWDDLVSSALFGTERRSWQPPSGSSPVETLLRAIPAEPSAGLVLHSAAILTTYRRSGTLLTKSAAPLPSACPADTLAKPGPRSSGHLGAMRNGTHPELIPIAFAAMAESAQRLPEELVPAFLEMATRSEKLRESLSLVAGTCGKWLAAQNPTWAWLITEAMPSQDDVPALWETGTPEQRTALLRHLRKTAPSTAHALILSTWAQEKADQRAQFLSTLRTGLSMEDEPFLEERLNDKSIAVRWQAADLLANLPDSRLLSRMRDRLQPLLRLESKGRLRRTEVLELDLPEKTEPALLRDGIRPQAFGGQSVQAGEKASAIAQMLALVPPAVWSQTLSRSPQDLLAAAAAGDWKDLLWTAWLNATGRHRDRDWAMALAQVLPAESTLELLLNILDAAERDTMLCRAAESLDESDLMTQMARFPAPWSLRLTRTVLKRVRKAGENMCPYLCRATLAVLPALDPQAATEISNDWPPEMSALAAGLEFHHNLLRDIRNRI